MTDIRINYETNTITITKKFEKLARNYNTKEYTKLCRVRNQFPDFQVVTHTIKKNSHKESYKGLSYDYMKRYIIRNEPTATTQKRLQELEDLLFIAECHSNSRRYPVIKKWFLETYPEIAKFGIPSVECEEETVVQEQKTPATILDNDLPEAG